MVKAKIGGIINTDKSTINMLQKQIAQLKKKIVYWHDADEEIPKQNVSLLVFIPEEDNHITAGMWDVSEKWILLDEYRVPICKVTHWAYMPESPKQ